MQQYVTVSQLPGIYLTLSLVHLLGHIKTQRPYSKYSPEACSDTLQVYRQKMKSGLFTYPPPLPP